LATACAQSKPSWQVIALTLTLACVACGDDKTAGQFELHAADGFRADVHGPAYAKTESEAGGYWITFDLTHEQSILQSQEALSFVFPEKPDTGSWPSIDRLVVNAVGFKPSFDVGSCNVATRWDSDSTIASYWHVDSGRVLISTPRAQSGVTGTFRLFASRTSCRGEDKLRDLGGRVVMAGRFETRAWDRHPLRDFVRFLFTGAN
jgi:hypothetical protein